MNEASAVRYRAVFKQMSDDNSSSIELNRRRVLGALGTVGVASAGAGAGTFALFSDTEESSGNSVQAGTLDLSDGFSSASFTVDGGGNGIAPGDQGTEYFELTNNGSLGGSLDFNINDVSVNQLDSSEAADEGVSQGVFEINYGVTGGQTNFGPGAGDLIWLGDTGLDTQVTSATLDNGSGNPEVTVELGIALTSSTGGSAEVVFDTDDDGFEDLRVGVEPGKADDGSHDSDGIYHKSVDSQGSLSSKQAGAPSEVASVSYNESDAELTVALDANSSSVSTSSIGISGQVIYPGGATSVDFDGNQLYTPIIPSKAEGDSFGQGGGIDSGTFITIDGNLRRLDDILKLSFTVDSGFDASTDVRGDTLITQSGGDPAPRAAEGRPSRISGVDYSSNIGLSAGNTTYLVVEYELPADASNAVQGEEVTLDIEAELNQNDSQ